MLIRMKAFEESHKATETDKLLPHGTKIYERYF